MFNEKSFLLFVSLINPFGRIARITKKVFNVLGFVAEELVNKTLNELIPSCLVEEHTGLIERFIEGKDEKRVFSRINY